MRFTNDLALHERKPAEIRNSQLRKEIEQLQAEGAGFTCYHIRFYQGRAPTSRTAEAIYVPGRGEIGVAGSLDDDARISWWPTTTGNVSADLRERYCR